MTTAPPASRRQTRTGVDVDQARLWLDEHGFPEPHEEAWLNTPVTEITRRLAHAEPATTQHVALQTVDELAGRHGQTRIVMVNGAHVPALSDPVPHAPGLWYGSLTTLTEGVIDHLTTPALEPIDGFDALNRSAAPDVVVVQIESGVALDSPIQIVHISTPEGNGTVSHPRVIVDVGPSSACRLIESFVGLAGGAITNASTTIRLDDHARVDHHRVQDEACDAVHIGRLRFEQRRDSYIRSTTVTSGAATSRLGIDVTLDGEGAQCDLDGLYLPTGTQHHDTVVTVDHSASRCTSTQLFKGLADDHAHGSFLGHVIVRPDTHATTAHQTNRNLVLASTARVDSRPWLEIFADDVRCDHGSATGRLDDDALFYLRSRGIPRSHARSMLLEAFAREITDRVTPVSLRTELETLITNGQR